MYNIVDNGTSLMSLSFVYMYIDLYITHACIVYMYCVSVIIITVELPNSYSGAFKQGTQDQ